jgi:hypothetical protein
MVSATARGGLGRPRRARLWLPDGDELFRPVEGQVGAGQVGAGSVGAGQVGAGSGFERARPRILHEVAS